MKMIKVVDKVAKVDIFVVGFKVVKLGVLRRLKQESGRGNILEKMAGATTRISHNTLVQIRRRMDHTMKSSSITAGMWGTAKHNRPDFQLAKNAVMRREFSRGSRVQRPRPKSLNYQVCLATCPVVAF
jgi:hypothetical protein